jgi:hypothetical protein
MLKHRPAGALPSDRQRKEVSKGKKQDKVSGFSVQRVAPGGGDRFEAKNKKPISRAF